MNNALYTELAAYGNQLDRDDSLTDREKSRRFSGYLVGLLKRGHSPDDVYDAFLAWLIDQAMGPFSLN
jgi:hypothetical protein